MSSVIINRQAKDFLSGLLRTAELGDILLTVSSGGQVVLPGRYNVVGDRPHCTQRSHYVGVVVVTLDT
jgi:hypothetical protein